MECVIAREIYSLPWYSPGRVRVGDWLRKIG